MGAKIARCNGLFAFVRDHLDESDSEIVRVWRGSHPHSECTVASVQKIRGLMTGKKSAAYVPTPEDIRAECERIRASWQSKKQAQLQRAGRPN